MPAFPPSGLSAFPLASVLARRQVVRQDEKIASPHSRIHGFGLSGSPACMHSRIRARPHSRIR